jgi:hypothetical protein
MKTFTTTLCLVLLTLMAVTSNAQSKRSGPPLLFANLPASIDFSETQLADLFRLSEGRTLNLPVAENIVLNGAITSNLIKYSNLQTLVIKLPAYQNSFFSLSKQHEQNKISYVGRIFNPAFADGYELKPAGNGRYQLVKIGTGNTLTDCRL